MLTMGSQFGQQAQTVGVSGRRLDQTFAEPQANRSVLAQVTVDQEGCTAETFLKGGARQDIEIDQDRFDGRGGQFLDQQPIGAGGKLPMDQLEGFAATIGGDLMDFPLISPSGGGDFSRPAPAIRRNRRRAGTRRGKDHGLLFEMKRTTPHEKIDRENRAESRLAKRVPAAGGKTEGNFFFSGFTFTNHLEGGTFAE